MARKRAVEAVKEGFKHLNKTPYLWGGGDWSGIDCSHFVWRCYEYGSYYTTKAMVQSSSLTAFGFTKSTFSSSKVYFGDIVVFDGHTGICAPSNITTGSLGVLQSYGGHGVGWLPGAYGGGHWTHMYHPIEGWDEVPIKWDSST